MQKLIVLALVVAVVWYGFRFLGRLQKARKEEAKLRERQGAQPARSAARDDGNGTIEDLVPCPSCGAYVRAGSTCSCGRKA